MTDQSVISSTPPHTIRRRQPDRRARLLDAAFTVFGRNGLANARLEDIAHLAGVAKGTIYLYFDSKEALFVALVHDALVASTSSRPAGAAHLPTESASARLTTVLREWWAGLRAERYGIIARLMLGELHRFPQLVEAYDLKVIAPRRAAVADIIDHGISTGEFRPLEPQTAARMITAIAVANGLWASHRTLFPSLADLSDDGTIDAILDFALSALRAPTPAR
jgi:AcrR family transcriptional regulator